MGANGFGRSLLFGALAGAGLLAGLVLLAPAVPPRALLGLALPALAVLYVMGIAPSPRRGLAGGALAAVLAAPLLLLGPAASAVGAAAVVSLCRSAFLYRARPLRALAVEGALGVAGLGLGHHLAGPGAASWALAVWGYFLVQSLFFLVGGTRPRGVDEPAADPFDTARERLLSLLE